MADRLVSQLSTGSLSDNSLGLFADPTTGTGMQTSFRAMKDYFASGGGGTVNTGSLLPTASFNAYTSSANAQILNVYASESNYTPTSSFNTLSGSVNNLSSSYHTDSGSFYTRDANIFASQSNYVQLSFFNTYTGSIPAAPSLASLNTFTGSISTQVTNVFASQSNYILTSSFTAFSSSVNSRLTGSSTVISNVDGTIAVTNSTTASLNLNNVNTWTAKQSFSGSVTASFGTAQGMVISQSFQASASNDIIVGQDTNYTFNTGSFTGVTSIGKRITITNISGSVVPGLYLRNASTASFAIAQNSPAIVLEGQAGVNSPSGSQIGKFITFVVPAGAASTSTATYVIQSSINGSAPTSRFLLADNAIAPNFTNTGLQIVGGGLSFSGTATQANSFRVGAPWTFQNTSTLSVAGNTGYTFSHGGSAATSGQVNMMALGSTINPTSGTNNYNSLLFSEVFTQTGGASGKMRSILISPTLGSGSVANYAAIEVTSGSVLFQNIGVGGTNPTSSNLAIAGSTTLAAMMNLSSGSRPTAPKWGDVWLDPTGSLKIFLGSDKTFTLS